MPPTIANPDQWMARQLEMLWAAVRGIKNQTEYILDPTIANPSAGTPNAKVIIGDISQDQFGNSTGLTGWGIASRKTGTWVSL